MVNDAYRYNKYPGFHMPTKNGQDKIIVNLKNHYDITTGVIHEHDHSYLSKLQHKKQDSG